MAEQEGDSGEKEFEASDEKRRHAREEGNIPQSKELNALALIFGILSGGLMIQTFIGAQIFGDFSAILYHADTYSEDIFDSSGLAIRGLISGLVVKLAIVFAVLAAVVFLALFVQQAITFSTKKIAVDMKKISPIENLKKKYGARGLIEFLKDTIKLAFASAIALTFMVQLARDYYSSTAMELSHFAGFTFGQALKLILWFFVFQLGLTVLDLPIQRRLHANQLKMTREEVKREVKQSEGDPQLKQSRRQAGRRIANGEMLQNVKTATVVMVNPEHYAVALLWNPDDKKAPVCVAKGVDHLAAKIREIAIENNVPIVRDPPATRSMYRLVEVDEEIRPEHFAAVAAAINFVERVRKHM